MKNKIYTPSKEDLISLGFNHIKGSMYSFQDGYIVFLKTKKGYEWYLKSLQLFPRNKSEVELLISSFNPKNIG